MSTQKRNLVAVVAIAISCLLPNLASAQFERDPEVIKAYEAGEAALQAEDWEGAIAAFDRALADTTFAEAHLGRAEALRQLEDYSNAITSYRDALQINEKLAKAFNGRGICYREQGELNLALNDFQNAAQEDRRDPEIAANLGDILVNNAQNPVEAMQYLDRAIEFDPENAEAFRNRGWAHTLLREFEEGIADLSKAVELDPEDYETYQRLASVHQAEKDYQLAIEAISNAIRTYQPEENSDPDSYINGYLLRASLRLELAKEDETTPEQRSEIYKAMVGDADAVLDEFPDRFPESGLALFRRGKALRMQGLYGEAISALTDAIQLIPTGGESNYTGEAYLIRGICWFYQGQNNLARGDFKEAASQSQGLAEPRPHLWIGFTHAEEGEYRKAIESYGEATAENPSYALAHVNRGLAYMQLKDYRKAIDNFDEAIRAEPTEPKHFFKKGFAHELFNEPQKALDSYQLALNRDPDFVDANRGAARVLRVLGRPGLSEQYDNRVN